MRKEHLDNVKMRPSMALLILVLTISQKMITVTGTASEMQRTTELFANRSPSEWREVWHHERHRRCYHELVSHMDWVCRNDIYRSKHKRQNVAETNNPVEDEKEGTLESSTGKATVDRSGIFLRREVALSMLSARHQRAKRGIMDECCSSDGCSWEEYAEYCPVNRRSRTRNSP